MEAAAVANTAQRKTKEGAFMQEFLTRFEGPILLWIQECVRSELLTPVMIFITHLGDQGRIWIAIAALCLLFGRTRKAGVCMACALLLNFVLNNLILKNLFVRARPYETVEGLQRIIEAQRDFSFPSGHTGSSFAAATVTFLLCPRWAGMSALALASLVALSRLYVGVHFPTDILGGALVGVAAALVVCKLCRRNRR